MPYCSVCKRNRIVRLGFTKADQFCGLCGKRLRWLSSSVQLPKTEANESRELEAWIYLSEDNQWKVPVQLHYVNSEGERVGGVPVPVHDDNPGTLQKPPGNSYPIEQFTQQEECTEFTLPLPDNFVPEPGGNKATLQLHGDFGEESLNLRVCGKPEISFEVLSEYQADKPGGGSYCVGQKATVTLWRKAAAVPVTVKIGTQGAPVHSIEPFVVTEKPDGCQCTPRALGDLRPGSSKEIEFVLDTSDWTTDSEHTLKMKLPLHAIPARSTPEIELDLAYVDYGDLAFSSPDKAGSIAVVDASYKIEFEQIVRGSTARCSVTVANICNSPVGPLSARCVMGSGGAPIPCPWIKIRKEDSNIPRTSGGGQHTIEVTFDTSQLPDEGRDKKWQSANGRILIGESSTADHGDLGRQWEIPVRLREIFVPKRLPALAIDFGSINTAAAYYDPEDTTVIKECSLADSPDKPAPLATIPSIVFFRDLSDPKNPEILIGNEALNRVGLPTADAVNPITPNAKLLPCLAEDVKRWIGREQEIWVSDPNGNEERFQAEEIVKLAIREIVDIARRHWSVEHIEFSFPTKFKRSQEKAYDAILDELREDLTRLGLTTGELRIDVATAGAIAHLDPANTQDLFANGKECIRAALVDWGGGTLDICILEINRVTSGGNVSYEATYRGFGGDPQLGGNDVTYAMVAVLAERLNKVLADEIDDNDSENGERRPSDRIAISWPTENKRNEHQCYNFHLLRIIAEWWKIYRSDNPPGGFQHEKQVRQYLGMLKDSEGTTISELTAGYGEAPMNAFWKCVAEITLKDFYNAPLIHQKRTELGTIRHWVKKAIDNIARQAGSSGLDYVLLAGSGSRLPLLQEILAKKLPNAEIRIDRNVAKLRVARGLASYVREDQLHRSVFKGFHKPSEILRAWLGWMGDDDEFKWIIPIGTHWRYGASLNGERTKTFKFELPRRLISGKPRRLFLSAYGSSLFSDACEFLLHDPDAADPLPEFEGTFCPATLSIVGHEKLDLHINIEGGTYGPFAVKWVRAPDDF